MVAIFHAKRVALAHLYLVRGKYACRGVDMAIYADIARFVVMFENCVNSEVIEKSRKADAALSNNVYLSRIAKEVMC